MKLIDILKEIGEGSKEPYPYKRSSLNVDTSNFTWITEDGTKYEMEIFKDNYARQHPLDTYDISFGIVRKSKTGDYSYVDYKSTSKDTKTGNVFRVMATVVDIVKKEIALDKKKFKKEPHVLTFSPTKEDESDDRRLKLYTAYIQKQMPNAKVTTNSRGTITVNLV